MRKAQSAMEYLMTYGWAILVVIVILGALYFIGVLNPGNVIPSSCSIPPSARLACSSYILYTNGTLNLLIDQGTGGTVMFTGITCCQGDDAHDWTALNVNVSSGKQWSINTTCTLKDSTVATGKLGTMERFKLYINFTERADPPRARRVVADVAARYE